MLEGLQVMDLGLDLGEAAVFEIELLESWEREELLRDSLQIGAVTKGE